MTNTEDSVLKAYLAASVAFADACEKVRMGARLHENGDHITMAHVRLLRSALEDLMPIAHNLGVRLHDEAQPVDQFIARDHRTKTEGRMDEPERP